MNFFIIKILILFITAAFSQILLNNTFCVFRDLCNTKQIKIFNFL